MNFEILNADCALAQREQSNKIKAPKAIDAMKSNEPDDFRKVADIYAVMVKEIESDEY